jgi:hypothetical protein
MLNQANPEELGEAYQGEVGRMKLRQMLVVRMEIQHSLHYVLEISWVYKS